jgi:hypothetical protein
VNAGVTPTSGAPASGPPADRLTAAEDGWQADFAVPYRTDVDHGRARRHDPDISGYEDQAVPPEPAAPEPAAHAAAPPQSVDRSPAVDPLDRIDEISAFIEAARAVPMSSNAMVNRNEILAMLDELRGDLPAEIRHAQALLDERDKVIEAGQREAERIIGEGEVEHARLVSIAEVTVSAEHEASRIVAEARADAQRLRDEVEEYVDTTLANFEQMLQRTMATVERGRDKMRALSEIGNFDGQSDEKPLPF